MLIAISNYYYIVQLDFRYHKIPLYKNYSIKTCAEKLKHRYSDAICIKYRSENSFPLFTLSIYYLSRPFGI